MRMASLFFAFMISLLHAKMLAACTHWVLGCSLQYSHGVCFEADTMFRYSFKILPDRLKLIRLYMLVGLSGKISVSSSELELAIL